MKNGNLLLFNEIHNKYINTVFYHQTGHIVTERKRPKIFSYTTIVKYVMVHFPQKKISLFSTGCPWAHFSEFVFICFFPSLLHQTCHEIFLHNMPVLLLSSQRHSPMDKSAGTWTTLKFHQGCLIRNKQDKKNDNFDGSHFTNKKPLVSICYALCIKI